jgi:hypothetical protein
MQLRERWAQMVTGEAGPGYNAPSEVRRLIARTVLARRLQPGWRNRDYTRILDERQYHGLALPNLTANIGLRPEVHEANRRIVSEEWSRPTNPEDATHFYMRDYRKNKDGEWVGSNNPPYWATAENKVSEYAWEHPSGKKQTRVYFHRLER